MNLVFAGLKLTGKVETVWAVMNLGELQNSESYYQLHNYVIVWGRRGGKLQTLIRPRQPLVIVHDRIYLPETWIYASHIVAQCGYGSTLINKIFCMIRKGYIPVESDKLSEVYPEFEKDLDKINFWQQFKI